MELTHDRYYSEVQKAAVCRGTPVFGSLPPLVRRAVSEADHSAMGKVHGNGTLSPQSRLEFCAMPVTQLGMADENSHSGRQGNPPWQAKTLWVAAGLTLLGLVLWVAAPRKSPPLTSAGGEATLAQASGEAVATQVYSLQGSPAMFRFGLSYISGFFLGYGLRRFVKLTLLLSLVAAAAVFLMHKAGWIELDWNSVERHLSDSLAWLQGQAEALKVFATGYIPSAVAAGVGLFMGARWR